MHLRRALLLMALVLGVVAVVEALAPVPHGRAPTRPPEVAPAVAPPEPTRTVRLRYPARGSGARIRVPPDAHVVLEVEASTAGQAAIPGLGLVGPADATTPARFDLLATRPGEYDVTFEPALVGAAPRADGIARVGRLVVGVRG